MDWSALSFPASGAIDHVVLNLTRTKSGWPRISTWRTGVVLGAAETVQPKPDLR